MRLRVVALGIGASCSLAGLACSEDVPFDRPVTQFVGQSLGGVAEILRYAVAEPDRGRTAILFLGYPTRPGAMPEAIQVLGPADQETQLADEEGADCTFQHVSVVRIGAAVFALSATRVFEAASMLQGGQAAPAPMDIQIYRLTQDGNPGRSALVFKAEDGPSRTRPVCTTAEVQAQIAAVEKSLSSSQIRMPWHIGKTLLRQKEVLANFYILGAMGRVVGLLTGLAGASGQPGPARRAVSALQGLVSTDHDTRTDRCRCERVKMKPDGLAEQKPLPEHAPADLPLSPAKGVIQEPWAT